MLGEDQAAETGNGGQSRYQHGFAGAFGKDARILLLSDPIEDVNAVGDTDADDEEDLEDDEDDLDEDDDDVEEDDEEDDEWK